MPSALKRFSFEHWGLVAAILWMVVFLYDSIPSEPALNISPVTERHVTQDAPPSVVGGGK